MNAKTPAAVFTGAGVEGDEESVDAIGRPGSDRLSRVLRRSIMGAEAFHGRVRNGIGCGRPAKTTRSANRISLEAGFSGRALRWSEDSPAPTGAARLVARQPSGRMSAPALEALRMKPMIIASAMMMGE